LEIIAAFVIGILGSFHCLGMCGPIAIALPKRNDNWWINHFGNLLYNAGRIVTYSILGLVFGLFGSGLVLFTTQQTVSIIAGVLLILSVTVPLVIKKVFFLESLFNQLLIKIKAGLGSRFHKKSLINLLMIGMLNGLLPCGLVYIAIGGAIATGDVFHAVAFMFFFGLGTLPMMYSIVIVSNVISLNIRNKIKRWIPVFVIILGLLFILRGLNLGIPFVSPAMQQGSTVPECVE
jgi:uncharacterized protein